MHKQPKLTRFSENVLSKYQIYNSIFMTLPFDTINKTGVLLPLFHDICSDGFSKNMNPHEIVDSFFKTYQENPSEKEKINLLFRFIQYIERQVVLFDAIEDAAFPIVNNMDGVGTLRNSKETAALENKMEALKERCGDDKPKMQKEMMALYKTEKVNPAAGCLPILMQIPIFFSLYKVIFVTLELRHAPFFGWIRDLSAPDPSSILNLFGLLPFAVPEAGSMFAIISLGEFITPPMILMSGRILPP